MNEKTRTIVFNLSASLLLVSAGLFLAFPHIAPYLFAVGAADQAICHLTLSTRGMNLRRRRLQRYNIFAGLLYIFASVLMFKGQKEWIICLTIAALFQLYTAFVIPKND